MHLRYWFKMSLVSLWMVIVSVYTLISCVWRWGDANLIRDWFHAYAWGGLKILGIKLRVQGRENPTQQQPAVYILNHQSGLDLITFGTFLPPRTVTVAKKEIAWVPFMGLIFLAGKCILVDRKKKDQAVGAMQQAAQQIRDHQMSVGVFPEGTRNKVNSDLLPFKKGGFHLAIEAQVPIVCCICSPLKPLYRHEERKALPGTLEIRFLPPYSVAGKTKEDIPQIMAEIREVFEKNYREIKTELA